ncbi:MAG: hypothetical protein WCT02_00805 [Candidatus Paceibacterota bacterium]
MNNKKITIFIALALLLVSTTEVKLAQAQTNSNEGQTKAEIKANAQSKAAADRMTKAQAQANKMIDERIANLSKLSARVSEIKNVSDKEKAYIISNIQTLITNLSNLKAEIDSSTSSTTIKTDLEGITKNYRVYALVMPQLNILAAGDRIITISDMMTTVLTKLETRLTNASSTASVTTAIDTLNSLLPKIADAKVQANNAVKAVAVLVPDNGDKAVMASNTATLKAARAQIKAGEKDLQDVRKGITTIFRSLPKAAKADVKSASTTQTIGQ